MRDYYAFARLDRLLWMARHGAGQLIWDLTMMMMNSSWRNGRSEKEKFVALSLLLNG
jgi:hypothetical protein